MSPSAISPAPRHLSLTAVASALPLVVGGPFVAFTAWVAEEARTAAGETLPQPQRSLLVHDDDMTSTLAAFHREPIDLAVRELRRDEATLHRRVALVGRDSGEVVEVGAIAIALSAFPAAARHELVAGERPLGTVLVEHTIPFVSRPHAFFSIPAGPLADELPAADRDTVLWGRLNRLTTAAGEVLAEVIEILPPVAHGR